MQIQGCCRSRSANQLQSTLSACLDEVCDWMQSNHLQLNIAKTCKDRNPLVFDHTSAAVCVGKNHVLPSTTVRDLRILINVAMRSYVSRTVSGCFAALRQLRSIRCSVSDSVFHLLVMLLIMSHLDYGNATLAGPPAYQVYQLPSVLIAAARLTHRSSRYEHITSML